MTVPRAVDIFADPDREATRLSHAEAVDALLAPVEEAFAEALRRTFARAVAAVGLSLVAAGVEELDPNGLGAMQAGWAAEVVRLAPIVAEMYEAGALGAWVAHEGAHAAALADPDLDPFDVVNRGAVEHMSAATNRLSGIGDAAWSDARRTLTTAIEEGWDVERTTKAMQDRLDVAEARARTVARTETIGAANAGSIEGIRALGEHGPQIKEWMAAGDSRTRDSHYVADGQRRPLDVPFDVGGAKMARPLDPTAPAREVVNCRCTLLFDEAKDGEEATAGREVDSGTRQVEGQVPTGKPQPVPHFPKATTSPRVIETDAAGRAWGAQASRDWQANLSDDARGAMNAYIGSGYRKTNRALRAGEPLDNVTVSGSFHEGSARALDDALRQGATPEPLVLWRGIDHDVSGLAPGSVIQDQAFVSTGLSPESIVKGWSDADATVVRITAPAGTPGGFIGDINPDVAWGDPPEWLLPTGSSMRVVRYTPGSAAGPGLLEVEMVL